jgi:hypothetical protein
MKNVLFEQLLLQGATEVAIVVLALIAALIILWAIVSIPVWLAAKIITRGKARFTRAMLVTAVGPVVYGIVFFISNAALAATGGFVFVSFILAFIAWIAVFKYGFDTGWLRALGIAVLATVVFIVIGAMITVILQMVIPDAPAITPLPSFNV